MDISRSLWHRTDTPVDASASSSTRTHTMQWQRSPIGCVRHRSLGRRRRINLICPSTALLYSWPVQQLLSSSSPAASAAATAEYRLFPFWELNSGTGELRSCFRFRKSVTCCDKTRKLAAERKYYTKTVLKSDSVAVFKSRLKTFLFSQAFSLSSAY